MRPFAQAMVLMTLLVIWTEPATWERCGLQDSCGNLVAKITWVNVYLLRDCYQKNVVRKTPAKGPGHPAMDRILCGEG